MNVELLACKRMTAGVLYPPYLLQPQQVNHIYAEITERYPFQTLQHLPDGARMANPTGDFFIQTTRMQVNDTVDFFQSSKERAVDLFRLAQERLLIPRFSTFGVKLIAFLPLEGGPNAARVIEETALASIRENMNLLGAGRQGVGLRFVLHQDGVYEVKIEPFFSDLNQIYVEVDVQHPTEFSDILSVESKMDSAYDYLFGEVRRFLKSLD